VGSRAGNSHARHHYPRSLNRIWLGQCMTPTLESGNGEYWKAEEQQLLHGALLTGAALPDKVTIPRSSYENPYALPPCSGPPRREWGVRQAERPPGSEAAGFQSGNFQVFTRNPLKAWPGRPSRP
jgi:hypothetical protein